MTSHLVGKCLLTAVLVAGTVSLTFAESEKDKDGERNNAFSFAVMGDQPYAPTTGTTPNRQLYPAPKYEAMIADINSNKELAFVAHVGDIKEGNTFCEDAVYAQNLVYFNRFRAPVIFTPGDNEWTDCHRATNGSMDPIGRLSLIRTTFFSTSQSLGPDKITLTRQPGYPENARWQIGRVIFVTLNMPGSNNNRNRTGLFSDNDAEYTARNAANLQWVNDAFHLASSDPKNVGIMFFFQANPFERFVESGQNYTVSGYAGFVSLLRTKTRQYNKPVVVAHGDTHYFRVDHPLTGTYPGCTASTGACVPLAAPGSATDRVNNFTRLEVFAQNDVHWTQVSVDPKDPNVFSFMPMRVPGN